MWTIGYDQVLDEPSSSSSVITLSENRSRIPSMSQPSAMKLQSNPGQISMDSDAESEDGDVKSSEMLVRPRLSITTEQSFDDEPESNSNKDALTVPSTSSLSSPTGSDKFIVVTDVEIQEAKAISTHSETLVKSSYLDLKEGQSSIIEERYLK